MKTYKDGKLKLSKSEKRIGNFVIKKEEIHMKVFDINQIFTHRALRTTAVGKFLEQCYDGLADEKTSRGLSNYIAVLFSVFSTVPDLEFLETVYKASEDCMKRHPEIYGVPTGDVSDKEQEEIVEDEKSLLQFEDEVKAAVEE